MGDSFTFTNIRLKTKLGYFCFSIVGQIQYNFTGNRPIAFIDCTQYIKQKIYPSGSLKIKFTSFYRFFLNPGSIFFNTAFLKTFFIILKIVQSKYKIPFKIWKHFKYGLFEDGISNGTVFIGLDNSFSLRYGPNHLKTGTFKILTFLSQFQMVLING